MKFNFFKKIWGRKEKEDEVKKESLEKEVSTKKEFNFEPYSGIDFKIFPLRTEKTFKLLRKENKYTFLVDNKVNKDQIKKAIKKIFNVDVKDVKTMNYNKRIRGLTKIKSVRPKFKKAIVEIKEGQTISIFE
jgi:large subunit ribosomal protein L23